jgi:hypothetical protein
VSGDGVGDNDEPTTPKMLGGVTGKGFMPGKSGNTAGPHPQWLREAKEQLKGLVPLAGRTLKRVMVHGDDKAKVSAAKTVLEYTVPKPKQRLKVSGQLSNPVGELSIEEIQALIRATKGEGK